MSFKIDDNITLEDLITLFEENELELDQVPENIVNHYGYACLANALMFKEPEIPMYNNEINDYMQSHKFKSLDSLIRYIKNLDDDIDKLFAIFAYAALNIEYDTELFFSKNHKSTTLEEVFLTKKAVCAGYSIFFEEMAKRVNIDSKKIVIKEYSNFSKGYGYDATNPPSFPESNHASIFISINNVPFISEPTWAAGYLTDSKEFEWNFRPELFLIPLYKSLCDHFPCNESQHLLPFKFKYNHFTKAIKLNPFGRFIKSESCPKVILNCSTGYIKQIYSCVGPIERLSFKIWLKKGNMFSEIPIDGITSYEIIQTELKKHPNRCRFVTHVLFPKTGMFMVKMYINSEYALEYYVNNSNPCKGSIPLVFNPFHYSKFIPMKPKNILSIVQNGIRIIRFAVNKNCSRIKYEIMKLKDPNNFNLVGEIIDKKYGQYITLEIPFNDEFYENQLAIVFPSNGRYSVLISFINDNLKNYKFVRYFFDVKGVNPENLPKTNPMYYMCKGRKIAPMKYYDKKGNELLLKPSLNYYYVSEREQTLQIKTKSDDDNIYFELKNNDHTVERPKEIGCYDGFREIKWKMPDERGEYHLKGWINDEFCINLTYLYANLIFNEPSENEIILLNELENKINQIKLNENVYEKQNKEKQRKNIIISNPVKTHNNEQNDGNDKEIKGKDTTLNYNEKAAMAESNVENYKNENEILKRENEMLKIEIEKLKIDNDNNFKNETEKHKNEADKLLRENEFLRKENEKLKQENEEKQLNDAEKNKYLEMKEVLTLENERNLKEIEELKKENEILKKEKKERQENKKDVNENDENKKDINEKDENNSFVLNNDESRKISKCCVLI